MTPFLSSLKRFLRPLKNIEVNGVSLFTNASQEKANVILKHARFGVSLKKTHFDKNIFGFYRDARAHHVEIVSKQLDITSAGLGYETLSKLLEYDCKTRLDFSAEEKNFAVYDVVLALLTSGHKAILIESASSELCIYEAELPDEKLKIKGSARKILGPQMESMNVPRKIDTERIGEIVSHAMESKKKKT